MKSISIPLILIVGFNLSACREPTVRVYLETDTAETSAAAEPTKTHNFPSPALPISWDVPNGWLAVGSSGMRAETFQIPSQDGSVELTVIAFPGSAGGLLANVNRWREQLGLAPVANAELNEIVAIIDSELGPVSMVNLQAEQHDNAILGAAIEGFGQTWFFKLFASKDVVAAQQSNMVAFLQSLRATATQSQQLPVQKPMADAVPHVHTTYIPENWQPSQGSAMRLASFETIIEDEKADIAVFSFSGRTGGLAANINRWRGQLGMGEISEDVILANAKTCKCASGETFLLVQYVNPDNNLALHGAVLIDETRSWFVKMMGTEGIVAANETELIQFIQGLELAFDRH